jgi:hypothetical protein
VKSIYIYIGYYIYTYKVKGIGLGYLDGVYVKRLKRGW